MCGAVTMFDLASVTSFYAAIGWIPSNTVDEVVLCGNVVDGADSARVDRADVDDGVRALSTVANTVEYVEVSTRAGSSNDVFAPLTRLAQMIVAAERRRVPP